MLMTLRIGLPVWPSTRHHGHGTEMTHLVEDGVNSRDHVFASTKMDAPFGARSATWRTARFSVLLIFVPRNMASIRAWRPDSSASVQEA